jgi:hypothetical protein
LEKAGVIKMEIEMFFSFAIAVIVTAIICKALSKPRRKEVGVYEGYVPPNYHCPFCNRILSYRQTITLEKCPDCGKQW